MHVPLIFSERKQLGDFSKLNYFFADSTQKNYDNQTRDYQLDYYLRQGHRPDILGEKSYLGNFLVFNKYI